jgi:hypothetical protein
MCIKIDSLPPNTRQCNREGRTAKKETLLHNITLSIDILFPKLIHQRHPLIKFLLRLNLIREILFQKSNQIRINITYSQLTPHPKNSKEEGLLTTISHHNSTILPTKRTPPFSLPLQPYQTPNTIDMLTP